MKRQPVVIRGKVRLRDFDPGYRGDLSDKKIKKETKENRRRIDELQQRLYANCRHALLLIFQGMDASGKDGAVRSVLRRVNPAGVQTANFKVPSAEEAAHDYLWRIHHAVPRYGLIGVFNRSHYESVLAERVLALVPRHVWSERYDQIIDFERMLVNNNVVILKFFLHLGREEQAKRFRERLSNPKKYWKFSKADVATRERWDDYATAYEDVLNLTSHPAARWHLVPANDNAYRDLIISRQVVATLEELDLKWPKAATAVHRVRIK